MTTARSKGEITALLIAPDRALAHQFLAALSPTKAFRILADLTNYPPEQQLEIQARQLKPQVILLDLVTQLSTAVNLIHRAAGLTPSVHVIGLHNQNDSDAILQSLRAGASEFLYAPFDLAAQGEVMTRLRKLASPEAPPKQGHVVAFASAKPGSGASTVATQMAFSLKRSTGQRILLVDCDLAGGTLGFCLKLVSRYSLMDALENPGHLDRAAWNCLTVDGGGVDVLPAPAAPYDQPVDPARLQMIIEQARWCYDWVLLDLPTIFSPTSLTAFAECETAFLVSTAELPSLHLTRKALNVLDQLGVPRERFRVLVNRLEGRHEIGLDAMEKLFGRKVHAGLPEDIFSLHRVVTLGKAMETGGDLGRAIESVTARLTGSRSTSPKAASSASLKRVYSA